MNVFLLALGLLATAAGCVMVGFGIPINAFSLGNTLIIAGTVAISSGLILVALAAALGQLRRIAEALNGRALANIARAPESVGSMVPPTARMTPAGPTPVPTRAQMPPKPLDMQDAFPPDSRPASRPHDLRFPATTASEPPGPLDWLRAKGKPAASAPAVPAAGESSMVDVTDEAPLSPRPPQRPPASAEPVLEPKVWPPTGRANGPSPEFRRRMAPPPEPPKEPDVHQFDAVWDRPGPMPAETNRETKSEPSSPTGSSRDDQPPERRPEPVLKASSERMPTILKSGVIDGMPYTLYADGSIEAQLPQGTVKFASVDALRAHLEKHG
jgi:hypothetical protein